MFLLFALLSVIAAHAALVCIGAIIDWQDTKRAIIMHRVLRDMEGGRL